MKYKSKLKKNSKYNPENWRNPKKGSTYYQYRSCKGKKGYATTKDANKMIQHQKKKFGIDCNYYWCKFCHKYHLTNMPVINKL